ncbi:NAD(P)-dependent dehydrogenase (short-subunit alcohol dehydrogenase family) [Antricoccus suffuscus]|uniref:NAD(P)-dependent dehydrogenase (Short-subunit alcohol dehydrogenase family) n=1 Tax=Antricoccus suffuscus TaxID=1629062 RepID=A0A2T1A113_9ACTN|nr:SDR family oxidoreductase [Antricoccus suffuscus]PRZ42292.1 NAD(P)-dependent dehydrogenase (short-subunit alcohol dehydrogenase family) [Antricoccus suffuscus]
MPATPPFRLDDKIAVITGGSRGLGREMAFAFAEQGATVVVASRKEDSCIETAKEITAATGATALGIGCHVGKWADCDRLASTVLERFGKIDVLVNNAGMSPLYDKLTDVSEELFNKVLDVNLKGPFRLSALVGEQMVSAGGGVIINVSSTGSVAPRGDIIPYAMAKSGLNAMTLGLARGFSPTVRVNGIMPGPFLTDISEAWDMEAFERRAQNDIPLQRGGQPGEIVGAALYLASDASSYTTGTIIKVDGGSAYGAH